MTNDKKEPCEKCGATPTWQGMCDRCWHHHFVLRRFARDRQKEKKA